MQSLSKHWFTSDKMGWGKMSHMSQQEGDDAPDQVWGRSGQSGAKTFL